MATSDEPQMSSTPSRPGELAGRLVVMKRKRRRRDCAFERPYYDGYTGSSKTTTTVISLATSGKRKGRNNNHHPQLIFSSILAVHFLFMAASYSHSFITKVEAKKPEPTNSIFDTILGKSSESNPNQELSPTATSTSQQNQTLTSDANLTQQQQVIFNPSSGGSGHSLDAATRSYLNGQASDKVTLPGDILLGGLFPIHMKGAKAECGEINKDRGIQRLEAMLYALDRINQDQTLLPDIKLGAILLDSCSSSTYALNQSLEFIRASINTVESSAFECKDKSTPRPKYGSKMIAGVIGGSYSEVSLQVANLLRLFRIPQVSYASTGTALSDKTLYDLFARTVPSDMFQARAIADIVLKLKWSYVSLVSSEGLYGDSGSKEFMKQASARRICIATHEKISPAIGHSAYDAIVASLHKRNATGVVLFTRVEDSRALLLAVKRAGLYKNFAWIAADGWGTHQKLVEGVEDVARGAITVELQAKAIPGFDEYMKGLTPWQNGRNPWFSEYWQEWFECQLEAQLLQQQRLATGLSAYYPTTPSANSRRRDMNSGNTGYQEASDERDADSVRVRRHDADGSNTGPVTEELAIAGRASATSATVLEQMPQCQRPADTTTTATMTADPLRSHPTTGGGAVNNKDKTVNSKEESHRKSSGSGDQDLRCINSAEIEEFKRRKEKLQQQKENDKVEPIATRPKRSPNQDSDSGNDQTGSSQLAKMKRFCSPNLRINESNGYRQEQKVQFVVDAVYSMAHALHKAWYNLCDAQPGVVCEALKELNGGDFYSKYLLNVSFKDLAGSEVKFDERGDGLGRYNIYNFRQAKPQFGANPLRDSQQALMTGNSPDRVGESLSEFPPSGAYSNSSSMRRRRSRRHQNDSYTPEDPSTTYDETDDQSRATSDQEAGDGGDASGTSTLASAGQSLTSDGQTGGSASLMQGLGNGGQQTSEQQLMSSIEHIYTSNHDFEYSLIGRWTEEDYYLELNDIQSIMGDKVIPESYCSKPCELGQAKIMRAGDQCCWICKTCLPFEFLPDEFSCRDCGIGRWPIANKTSCFELPQKFLRWDSVYSLISLTIACLGIGLTLFVIVIFLKYLDTPVVKASGRELSFILLAGIAFCHLSTFVLLSKPTTFICGSQRFLVNFGFALMYASLLVKTNRISRIFNCARKTAKRPSFISPKSQMLITGILVTVQIFLTIVWFVLEPPGIRADSPEGKRDEVVLKCRTKGKSFIISLVYNMILITTCTIYAVKTRKIPENFNESKFIGFTMYTTIVIWLAFVTMFFGTNNSYEIQINTMCVCISLSAYVTLFCLFSPKISIILLHPDKNVRKLTMNSATYKRPFKPVSSMASVDGGRERSQAGGVTGGGGSGGISGARTGGGGGTNDGGSAGGPMSTTSNVLNLADGNRLQESSIVSNVVNSNSGASNCSQTGGMTTIGSGQQTQLQQQQQLAAIICLNCGAHQVAKIMADHHLVTNSSGATGSLSTTVNGSGSGATSSGANQRGVSCQQRASMNQSGTGRSASGASILRNGTSTQGSYSNKQQFVAVACPSASSGILPLNLGSSSHCTTQHGHDLVSGAKILHSSRVISDRSSTTTNLVKRMASDDHLVGHTRLDHHSTSALGKCAHSATTNKFYSAAGASGTATAMIVGVTESMSGGSIMAKASGSGIHRGDKRKHVASMSRLNDINTSTTSSDRAQGDIDESYSSLANDSYAGCLTSQDNTPCNRRASGGGRLSRAHQNPYNITGSSGKVASDSMLCNESIHSVDYCSECCPSYDCQCSCLVCSSNGNGNGDGDNGGGSGDHENNDLGGCGNGNSGGGGGTSSQSTTGSGANGSNGDNSTSSVVVGSGQTTADTYCIHGNSISSGGSQSARVVAGPGNTHLHLHHQQQQKQQHQHDNIPDDYDAIMCNSLVVTQQADHPANGSAANDTTTITTSKFVSRLVDHQTSDSTTVLAATGPIGTATFTSSGSSGCSQSLKFKSQKSEESNVVAKVHHSNSRPEVGVGPIKLVNSGNVMEMRTISSSVAISGGASGGASSGSVGGPRVQVAATSEPPTGVTGSGAPQPNSLAFALQAAAQSVLGATTCSQVPVAVGSAKSSDRKSSSYQQQQQKPGGGTIMASIEMVKSAAASGQMKQHKQQNCSRTGGSSGNQHHRGNSSSGGCFDYHDDYEYSYGLVQSDSESGRYFYGLEEEEDDDHDGGEEDDIEGDYEDDDPECEFMATPKDKSKLRQKPSHRNSKTMSLAKGNERLDGHHHRGKLVDADEDDEEDDDDDFGHDGRIISSVGRESNLATTTATATSGSKSSSGKSKGNKVDELRINSVALITATLSAGGAIMDSGTSTPTAKTVGSISGNDPPFAGPKPVNTTTTRKDESDNSGNKSGSSSRKDRMTFVTTI